MHINAPLGPGYYGCPFHLCDQVTSPAPPLRPGYNTRLHPPGLWACGRYSTNWNAFIFLHWIFPGWTLVSIKKITTRTRSHEIPPSPTSSGTRSQTPPPAKLAGGWHISYWNAFLFFDWIFQGLARDWAWKSIKIYHLSETVDPLPPPPEFNNLEIYPFLKLSILPKKWKMQRLYHLNPEFNTVTLTHLAFMSHDFVTVKCVMGRYTILTIYYLLHTSLLKENLRNKCIILKKIKAQQTFDKRVNKYILKHIKRFQITITHPVIHSYSKNIFWHYSKKKS